TGRTTSVGSVPKAFHDAAAAEIGHRLVIFGGGASTGTDAVQAYDPTTARSSVIGHLPLPLSDLAAAQVGRTVYLFGGYDGRFFQPTIYATEDGVHFRTAGRLPVGLRYPAVAATDGRIVIAGGVGLAGPTRSVYSFEPSTGKVRDVGSLPR